MTPPTQSLPDPFMGIYTLGLEFYGERYPDLIDLNSLFEVSNHSLRVFRIHDGKIPSCNNPVCNFFMIQKLLIVSNNLVQRTLLMLFCLSGQTSCCRHPHTGKMGPGIGNHWYFHRNRGKMVVCMYAMQERVHVKRMGSTVAISQK